VKLQNSKDLYSRAKAIIPGGVTNARHPSKFIKDKYPIFFKRGKGSHSWDVDDNEYIDWICSFGPLVLGHCNEEVDNAVIEDIRNGFCFTMVHPIQNKFIEKIIEIIPCAEMGKILTSGSDATSAAIRIARIYTNKTKVIRWGYHGWHDWCYGGAGTDREVIGVPNGIINDILSFEYNNIHSLEKAFEENKNDVACVIMQPFESSKELPENNFLESVKKVTHDNDAILIFDEIRTGFRVALGGAQEYFNVIPDMACYSKAMANGYPISVLVGKKDIMEVSKNTRISATFFPNTFPMTASLKTIDILIKNNAIEYMWEKGIKLVNGFKKIINDFDIRAEIIGLPVIPMLIFKYDDENINDNCKNIFFSEMIEKGILLHPNHHWFLSLAHTDEDIDQTLNAAERSFYILNKYLS
jgi:glutamate-1-semialdehyde 2,1-aminomutase/spore coat polysaccharide biosynthesis protein SpsF